ncbi:MAG: hypothetical protein MZV70_17240 [Desulfobacterales bacterium]|nr:hypothetical protein [Desulfobacterales bacterium]
MVKLKKPGKMRWDWRQAREEALHLRRRRAVGLRARGPSAVLQARSCKSQNLSAAVTFLTGKGKLADEFNFEPRPDGKVGAKGDYAVKLDAQGPLGAVQDDHARRRPQGLPGEALWWWPRPDGGRSKVWFYRRRPQQEARPAAPFTFTPPSGVKVIVAK